MKDWLKLILSYPTKGVSSLDRVFGFVLAVIVIFLMLFVSAEVVSRYFIKPIPGMVEIVKLIMPVVAFLGVAYAQSFRGHIRIELFLYKLKGRVYHFVESLWLVLSLGIFILLAIYTFGNTLDAYREGDITAFYYFPTWVSRLLISVGCAVLCFRLIIQLTQNLVQLAKGIERKDLNQSRMGG